MIELGQVNQCPKCGAQALQTKSIFVGPDKDHMEENEFTRCTSCGNSWQVPVNILVRTK